jgi:hypothetical protein
MTIEDRISRLESITADIQQNEISANDFEFLKRSESDNPEYLVFYKKLEIALSSTNEINLQSAIYNIKQSVVIERQYIINEIKSGCPSMTLFRILI